MAISSLKNLVLVPFLISSAVFSTLTLPLALLGSKPVVIRLQEEPVFDGRVRDIAAPYLGLAGLLSLGAGITSVAVTGWKRSSLKSAQFEQHLLGVQQHLKEKEALLEELRLSESRLETSGLHIFLDAEETGSKDAANRRTPVMETALDVKAAAIEMPAQVFESGSSGRAAEARNTASLQSVPIEKTQAAASAFQSAQTFLGFTQAGTLRNKPGAAVATQNSTTALLPVEELQSQIKQLMTQIETLQDSLQISTQPNTPEENQTISPLIHRHHQTQIVESWLMHKVAS